MQTIQEEKEADLNFKALSKNKYPGRGIVLGRSDSHFFQLYFITGRSPSSRNRILVDGGRKVFTELADPDKHQGDRSLIIYNAMRSTLTEQEQCWHIVSNGDQTDTVYEFAGSLSTKFPTLSRALNVRTYEPDAPNFTSRITGVIRAPRSLAGEPRFELSFLRRNIHTGKCDREFFQYEDIPANYGRLITTYAGDAPPGQALPAFNEKPLLVPIHFDPRATITRYWDALDRDNRVAIALKWIEIESGSTHVLIQNAYDAVPAGAD